MSNKIPVCDNIDSLRSFLEKHEKAKFCLYLACKSDEEWEKSTSRIYMNKIDESFIYLPVNIQKDDFEFLEAVYDFSQASSQVVAINQTQPHKSNPVLKKWLKGKNMPENIDSLVKDSKGHLQPFDLNGPSFVEWFEEELGSFKDRQIVILGVGGVGEPIAREVSKKQPRNIYLVDVVSKQHLADELSKESSVAYFPELEKLAALSGNVLLINCAGKEGASETGIINFLKMYKNENNLFIDLRPHLDIEIVERAKEAGWQSYTGFGMNARNDYVLLSKISKLINLQLPAFEKFQEAVASAS